MTPDSTGIEQGVPASVIVGDPEMLVRAGLRAVIDGDPSLQLVGEATEGGHAVELIARLRPRLAILATALRNPGGIEVAGHVRERSPATAVVLLGRPGDTGSMLAGFRAGATGFVRSDVARIDLLQSLHRALAGESVVDPIAAAELIMQMAATSEMVARVTPDPLTARELEILRLVAKGHTNRQIAERLIVAVGTIKVHVEHILGKLGATDRTQAAVRAVELGIVRGDDGDHPPAAIA